MLNRAALFDAIEREMAVAECAPLGVLVVRAQRLRQLELTTGYAAAEQVAARMLAVIAGALRPGDAVLQVGSCDFALLLPRLQGRNHVLLAAAKLVRLLEAPVHVDGREVLLPVSIGAAVHPDDGVTAEVLCRHADIACDAAMAGSERFALYTAPELSNAFAHADLRDAIAGNQLELYLQPITRLSDGRRCRVEALSRWHHPGFGSVAPEAFIHVAEESGLIGGLTRWSFNAAFRHAAQARDSGRQVDLSVNLSVGVLQQPGFLEQVLDLLKLWNLPPESVVLEVTESGLMGDLAQGERMLRLLRGHGFGIAIDDFGTGYSSMAYLRRLPATELKIDKSFVVDMRRDARVAKLVGSMIDLSHHLGIEVVAEGVEDEATLAMLEAMGCDHAQGYHLGRPLPAAEALAQLDCAIDGARAPG